MPIRSRGTRGKPGEPTAKVRRGRKGLLTQESSEPAPQELFLTLPGPEDANTTLRFTAAFRIGRGLDCAVRVDANDVSRDHTEVRWERGRWWARDLGSTNGTYLDGQRIDAAPLPDECTLRLGPDGVEMRVRVARETFADGEHTVPQARHSSSFILRRYLQSPETGKPGPRTEAIREVLLRMIRDRRRAYLISAVVVLVAVTGTAVFVSYQHEQIRRQTAGAEETFYAMKAMELQLARMETRLGGLESPTVKNELAQGRVRLAALEKSYAGNLVALGVYGERLTEQRRIVLRIARVFGECELAMPSTFFDEVDRFVAKWRSDQRLETALARAKNHNYGPRIAAEMLRQHLPPQFFYLALQESDFIPEVCGPETRFGIAKGLWQFLPITATAYGLRTGPLVALREPDPRDERHDFSKSTAAAARYLRDMYDNDAQGSGLLAVAAYNWGETNIRSLITSLPPNPRERNFWILLRTHRRLIPRQTYQYVMRVLSAAVIGENPRLFGFGFENPIGGVG